MPEETHENFVLKGHVVTMNDAFDEFPKGAVFVAGNGIVAVQAAAAPPPPGFEHAPVVNTKGTIFPGLIELHNHLSYNALRLWSVPKLYSNRDQWPNHPQYHQLVTGPMSALGKARRPELLAALVRYVESKCLFGGVTTSQGVALASNAGVQHYYRGVVRNVEQPGDPALQAARTHIADVEAKDWKKFRTAISGAASVILHLSEGTDEAAREHFLALKNGSDWAITDKLIGIHCAGLKAEDFDVFSKHGGSMVWSPLSNCLLYGKTADVAAARKSGVRVALGSDWSPSGSKNLLGELKAARLAADDAGFDLSNRDLLAMVTREPAKMVQWGKSLGSLEPGKRADLIVLRRAPRDPYAAILAASEADLSLVVIDGIARYGTPELLKALGAEFEEIQVAGGQRGVQYHDASANPDIDSVSLAEARATLATFFGSLGTPQAVPTPHAAAARPEPKVHLVLEELDVYKAQRPRLAYAGRVTGWKDSPHALAAAAALPLQNLEIDALTVHDDAEFAPTIAGQLNLPARLKAGLSKAHA
jgi:5-methylthioadenosine/S-adenosylhomocysteine deaminase